MRKEFTAIGFLIWHAANNQRNINASTQSFTPTHFPERGAFLDERKKKQKNKAKNEYKANNI